MKKLLLSIITITTLGANAQNLVTHYEFENNALDASGNLYHLVTNGTGTPYTYEGVAAKGNSCIHFQSGEGLQTSTFIVNTDWSGMAVSYWIKDSVNAVTYGTIAQFSGLGTYLTGNSGSIHTAFDGSYSGGLDSPSNQLNDGDWHHVVVQSDSTTTSVYIDGVLEGSQSEILFTSDTPLLLGNHSNNNATHKGDFYLDDFRLYDDTLSQAQITQLGTVTGILDQDNLISGISIYPNPSTSYITIDTEKQVLGMTIIDITGKKVKALSHNVKRIDVFDLTKGIYFLQLEIAEEEIIIKKIIKD